jgi:tRNA(Ile)-lysidine synthase
LEQFANRYPSLKAASTWGIAISGGVDSTALALAAVELNRSLVLLHANYRLRGAESDADEAFVKALGHPVEVLHPEVENSSEDHLRQLRYDWFATFDFPILTAHTQDDQAETVLHRMLRGTGPSGIASIQPCLGDHIFRPFLELTREDLRAFLKTKQQAWREDSSNQDLGYRRNYLRHVLIPQLQQQINPAAPAALARLAQLAHDEEEWLNSMTVDLLPHFAHCEGPAWILNAKHLSEAPLALQRRLLRQLLPNEDLSFDHIDAALALCHNPEGSGRIQLPGLDLLRSFDEVRVLRQADLPGGDRNFRLPLNIPGCTPLKCCPGAIAATLDKITPYNGDSRIADNTGLDWDLLQTAVNSGFPLELRNWRPGDEYQRPGRDRPDKLKELFQKFRIPLWQRRCWPIVVLKDEPVWARTFGPSAAFAATADSKNGLFLEFVPDPPLRD